MKRFVHVVCVALYMYTMGCMCIRSVLQVHPVGYEVSDISGAGIYLWYTLLCCYPLVAVYCQVSAGTVAQLLLKRHQQFRHKAYH